VVGLQKAKEMKLGICPICGGKTVRKNVDLTESIKNKIVIIEKVKAEVCSQCGERLYSEDEMKKIDVFLKKVKKGSIKPKTRREVEVYSLGY
jgi:YgiT-type zinc finger domain-containing protein